MLFPTEELGRQMLMDVMTFTQKLKLLLAPKHLAMLQNIDLVVNF